MSILRLPGLVDAHVHLREPGYPHKEDFYSGTAAALSGGVTTVLDMPNTDPPTATPARLREKARLAAAKAVCDVGLFVGATNTDADAYLPAAPHACGLKIYVSDTFGSLRIDTLDLLHRLFRTWAERAPPAQSVTAAPALRAGLAPLPSTPKS
jgi:dihydroorotase